MHLGKLESLIDYINEKGILTDRQYICGFRSKRSTNHAIIELVDEITKAIEKKKTEFTVRSSLDLSKAFDTVNHKYPSKKTLFLWYSWQMPCLD